MIKHFFLAVNQLYSKANESYYNWRTSLIKIKICFDYGKYKEIASSPSQEKKIITQKKGQKAEKLALNFLQAKGFKLISANYYCRMGEIDLIMQDQSYLVFIEVRYRSASAFGGGIYSITAAKKQKIIKAAQYFLMHFKGNPYLRFDVVCLDHDWSILWIKDAFGIDY